MGTSTDTPRAEFPPARYWRRWCADAEPPRPVLVGVEAVEDHAVPASVPGPAAVAARSGEDPYRVLIVEDDRSQALFATSVLAGAGIQAEAIADPDQVMARLRDQWTGGGALLFLDLRGTGAVAPGPSGSCQHVGLGGELMKLAHRYWMLGENLVCLWAYDILRGLEYLRSRPDIDPQRLGIHGCRIMAAPALLAAVADGGLQRALFMGLPASWADQIKSVYYDRSAVNEPTAIHGVLNRFDTPDLLMTLATTTKVEQN